MCPTSDALFRKVLVVGGGSGIGRAIALLLNKEGYQVAICGRRRKPLEEVCRTASGSQGMNLREADVENRSSVRNLFSWFDQEFGELDILIHAAGVNFANRSLRDLTEKEWDRLININLTGSFNCLKPALERMRPRKKGIVVLLNSVAGKRSTPLAGIGYNASKFGMSALGLAAAEEEKKNGIRITNIYPGEVNTPILEQRTHPPSENHRKNILQPEDIAEVVANLLTLPDRVHIPELVIKPTLQSYI